MGESGAKIVITADTLKAISEFNKLNAAANRTTQSAAGIGKELEKLPGAFAKSLIGAGAILGVIKEIATKSSEIRREAEEASKRTGKGAIAADVAGRRLGLSSQDAQQIAAGGGAKSREDMTGLLEALAESGGARGPRITRGQAFQVAEAFRRGTVTKEEAVDAAKRGGAGALLKKANERYAGLGPEARDELGILANENAAAEEADRVRSGRGRAERGTTAQLAAFKARNPVRGALLDTLESVPGAEAYERAMLEKPGGAGKPAESTWWTRMQDRNRDPIGYLLKKQTDIMTRDAAKPTLAPQVDP